VNFLKTKFQILYIINKRILRKSNILNKAIYYKNLKTTIQKLEEQVHRVTQSSKCQKREIKVSINGVIIKIINFLTY
jgi:hypothetical protein